MSDVTARRKIKVVLDTNIIISSVLCVDGNPAKIFELLLRDRIKNYTTDAILEEIKDVFMRPKIMKRLSLVEIDFIINNFERFSEKIESKTRFKVVKDDPDDDKFLKCAVSAKADYIISGDNHLLELREFRGMKILSPAVFIKVMEREGY